MPETKHDSPRKAGNTPGARGDKAGGTTVEYVTAVIGGHAFGLPVLSVRDVLRPQPLTRVPLSRSEVAGLLNLRGHIITVIDMRCLLDLPRADPRKAANMVIERAGEFYSLLFDSVGEVVRVPQSVISPNLPNMAKSWASLSCGIARTEAGLMILLDIERLTGVLTTDQMAA